MKSIDDPDFIRYLNRIEEIGKIQENLGDLDVSATEDQINEIFNSIPEKYFKNKTKFDNLLQAIISNLFGGSRKERSTLLFLEKMKDQIGHFFKNDEVHLIKIVEPYVFVNEWFFENNFLSVQTIVTESQFDTKLAQYFLPEIIENKPSLFYDILQISNSKDFQKELYFPLTNTSDKSSTFSEEELNEIKRRRKRQIEVYLSQDRDFFAFNSYDPDPLRCSLMSDDIDRFQNIISKNNISINSLCTPSIYDPAFFPKINYVTDEQRSLIEAAALFGSIKIFKFLLLNEAKLRPKEIFRRVLFGRNIDMFHMVENFIMKDAVMVKVKRKNHKSRRDEKAQKYIEIFLNINQSADDDDEEEENEDKNNESEENTNANKETDKEANETDNKKTPKDNENQNNDNENQNNDNENQNNDNESQNKDNESQNNDNESQNNDNESQNNDNESQNNDNESQNNDNENQNNDNENQNNDNENQNNDNENQNNDNENQNNDNESQNNDNENQNNDNENQNNDNESQNNDNENQNNDNERQNNDNESQNNDNESQNNDNESQNNDDNNKNDENNISNNNESISNDRSSDTCSIHQADDIFSNKKVTDDVTCDTKSDNKAHFVSSNEDAHYYYNEEEEEEEEEFIDDFIYISEDDSLADGDTSEDGDDDLIWVFDENSGSSHVIKEMFTNCMIFAIKYGLDHIVDYLYDNYDHLVDFEINTNIISEREVNFCLKNFRTKLLPIFINFPNDLDEYDNTYLMNAAYFNYTDIVKLLLRIPGIDVNCVNNTNNTTAMSRACDQHSYKTIEILLKCPLFKYTYDERAQVTPFIKAVAHGYVDEMMLLFDMKLNDKDDEKFKLLFADIELKRAFSVALHQNQREALMIILDNFKDFFFFGNSLNYEIRHAASKRCWDSLDCLVGILNQKKDYYEEKFKTQEFNSQKLIDFIEKVIKDKK